MAKAESSLTLLEMETKLGYKVDTSTYPDEHLERFYSDLRPVYHSTYQRTREEFEESERSRLRQSYATPLDESLQEIGLVRVSGRPLEID